MSTTKDGSTSNHLPHPSRLLVDTSGAQIVDDEDDVIFPHTPEERSINLESRPSTIRTKSGSPSGRPETSDIYLPKHTEWISHIAVDVSGRSATDSLFVHPFARSVDRWPK
jgi:hypothetical protein